MTGTDTPPRKLDSRQIERIEGMAFAREWKEHHRKAGTVWGIPPQPPKPKCSECGRPL